MLINIILLTRVLPKLIANATTKTTSDNDFILQKDIQENTKEGNKEDCSTTSPCSLLFLHRVNRSYIHTRHGQGIFFIT